MIAREFIAHERRCASQCSGARPKRRHAFTTYANSDHGLLDAADRAELQ
jgi:hypothetical protein